VPVLPNSKSRTLILILTAALIPAGALIPAATRARLSPVTLAGENAALSEQ